MRARLLLISLVLLYLGVELTTGFTQYVLRRYRDGVETFLNPNIQPDYLGMIGGNALTIIGLVGVVTWLWGSALMSGVAQSDRCPRCGADTNRIRRRGVHRVLGFVTAREVSRRACRRCSWKGLSLSA